MPSAETTRLRLEKQATGENNNTWGVKLNTVLDLIDDAIDGYTTIALAGISTTLTSNQFAADEARMAMLELAGTLVSSVQVFIPATQRKYLVRNATNGGFTVTMAVAGGTGTEVPQGSESWVYCDGVSVRRVIGGTSVSRPLIEANTQVSARAAIGLVSVIASSWTAPASFETNQAGQVVSVSPVNAVPTGTVWDFAGTSAPPGWLFCTGSAVSRTTFAALFVVIATAYGAGDGSTTFNLPDARGRVIAGKDNMGGSDAARLTAALTGGVDGDTLGAVGGEQGHIQTAAELVSHTHPGPSGRNFVTQQSGLGPNDYPGGSQLQTSSITGATGGGQAFNVVQPTLVMNKMIKT